MKDRGTVCEMMTLYSDRKKLVTCLPTLHDSCIWISFDLSFYLHITKQPGSTDSDAEQYHLHNIWQAASVSTGNCEELVTVNNNATSHITSIVWQPASTTAVHNQQYWHGYSGVLSCSALPAAKKHFSLNGKKRHHCRQRTNRCGTALTCYKCGKHNRRKNPSWHSGLQSGRNEVSAKVIFDKNGPLYIFVGKTEGFYYFQEKNDE